MLMRRAEGNSKVSTPDAVLEVTRSRFPSNHADNADEVSAKTRTNTAGQIASGGFVGGNEKRRGPRKRVARRSR